MVFCGFIAPNSSESGPDPEIGAPVPGTIGRLRPSLAGPVRPPTPGEGVADNDRPQTQPATIERRAGDW